MRPRGTPPMPRARSRASAPVGMTETFCAAASPIFMMAPLPNCRSIWPSAMSSALSRSTSRSFLTLLRTVSVAWDRSWLRSLASAPSEDTLHRTPVRIRYLPLQTERFKGLVARPLPPPHRSIDHHAVDQPACPDGLTDETRDVHRRPDPGQGEMRAIRSLFRRETRPDRRLLGDVGQVGQFLLALGHANPHHGRPCRVGERPDATEDDAERTRRGHLLEPVEKPLVGDLLDPAQVAQRGVPVLRWSQTAGYGQTGCGVGDGEHGVLAGPDRREDRVYHHLPLTARRVR